MMRKSISKILKPKGKTAFISQLDRNSLILDVGCGNNSPHKTKELLPSCYYVGIDVCEYNQTKQLNADEYIVVDPELFNKTIRSKTHSSDAVISAHNLEHCDNWQETLDAMISALKENGQIFIAFPSAESQFFPSRRGCLNYFDDKSHNLPAPDYHSVVTTLNKLDVEVVFGTTGYRPRLLWLLGLILEPISCFLAKVMPGTWAFYGFETIIWGRKRS